MEQKIDKIVAQLTLDEKIGMIHGDEIFATKAVERLGIPRLKTSDGPMGVRNEFHGKNWRRVGTTDDYVTYLPSNTALAATFNPNLAYRTGKILGSEARGRGKDVILAPGINIKRDPLCGRNFEYMSEDPKLVEEMVVPLIEGIQENDVAACVKHFALNNQETNRMWVDTYVDERTLNEIYFPGFKAAVKKGKSHSIMCSYNRFRTEHASESKYLLNHILREKWGYDGAIISDWGSVHNTKGAAESALDLEMSCSKEFDHYFFAKPLKEAVCRGEISESVIDEKVRNLLRLMFRLKMIGDEKENRKAGTYNDLASHEEVRKIAEEAVVLLKNEDNRLPLCKRKMKKLAIIGDNAAAIHANGGGSAEIKALYEISPLMGIKKYLGGNTEVAYAKGYYVPQPDYTDDFIWQENSMVDENDISQLVNSALLPPTQKLTEEQLVQITKKLKEEAVELAKTTDEVIIFGGLNHYYDVEGADRKNMTLPYAQEELIKEVLDVNPNTVIVIVAGSPIDYTSFAKRAKTIVWMSYAGCEGGSAIARILFGEVNPSGKLPETIGAAVEDYPAHQNGQFALTDFVTYEEGIFVGYRFFDSKKITPAFCFGHGLSYTTFFYSDLLVQKEKPDQITVSFLIKNTGEMTGKEVAQVYVAPQHSRVERPVHELKAFTKVDLVAGEAKRVSLTLTKQDFSYYDVLQKEFVLDEGGFVIEVGSSSRDIRLESKFFTFDYAI